MPDNTPIEALAETPAMRCVYNTCDVFTERRFGGNPLAVLTDARGLSDRQMQQVAREFNYSETTFVLPATENHTRHVRIFTPTREVPFAGHPNIGTAFVLAQTGALGALAERQTVSFEEAGGVVPVTIEAAAGRVTRCELEAPSPLTVGASSSPDAAAAALSLARADLGEHPPTLASVGLPMLFVELRDREALLRVRLDPTAFERLERDAGSEMVHAYARCDGEYDVCARMFAPAAGVPEDPATGSANCTLAGLLAHRDNKKDGVFGYRISQGVEMGRPSVLEARAEKRAGRVTGTWIGGTCVAVAEGTIEVD